MGIVIRKARWLFTAVEEKVRMCLAEYLESVQCSISLNSALSM